MKRAKTREKATAARNPYPCGFRRDARRTVPHPQAVRLSAFQIPSHLKNQLAKAAPTEWHLSTAHACRLHHYLQHTITPQQTKSTTLGAPMQQEQRQEAFPAHAPTFTTVKYESTVGTTAH